MTGTLIPNEAAFVKVLCCHACDDTEFKEIRDQRTLTISWECRCGFAGWVQLSAIRQGKFGEWMFTQAERNKMLRKLNGLLVIEDEREL